MCVGHISLCVSPLFCDDRATTSAGSISQGKPAADDSSYTFMATWNHTADRFGGGSGDTHRQWLQCLASHLHVRLSGDVVLEVLHRADQEGNVAREHLHQEGVTWCLCACWHWNINATLSVSIPRSHAQFKKQSLFNIIRQCIIWSFFKIRDHSDWDAKWQ